MINYNGGCIVYKTRLGMRRNIIEKCILFLLNKNYRTQILKSLGSYDSMNDKEFLEKMFKVYMGYELDLNNPKTFNEKLQWLKLYDRNPEYTKMVDKFEVKYYVNDRIGNEYTIPTLGVWEQFEEIDFSKLPNQFVLKCTHDCGGLVICRDKSKLNIKKAKRKINRSLNRNYYLSGREWPYKNVKPRIVGEKFIGIDGKTPEDYKILCINGKADNIMVCTDRDSGTTEFYFFNTKWELIRCNDWGKNAPENFTLEKPQNLEKMIQIAEKLSENIPLARIDLYNINGDIFFGEITFFPGSGFDSNLYYEEDLRLGQELDLKKVGKNENCRSTNF